jgi:hypothetical protein
LQCRQRWRTWSPGIAVQRAGPELAEPLSENDRRTGGAGVRTLLVNGLGAVGAFARAFAAERGQNVVPAGCYRCPRRPRRRRRAAS